LRLRSSFFSLEFCFCLRNCSSLPLVKVIRWLRDVAVALPLGVITFAENSQLIYSLFSFSFVAYPGLKQLFSPNFVA
jgi:hypothetical protein